MKICTYCGERNFDVKTECEHCHRPLVTGYVSKRTPFHGVVSAFIILTIVLDILGVIGLAVLWGKALYAHYIIGGSNSTAYAAVFYLICMILCVIQASAATLMNQSYIKKTCQGLPVRTSFKVCSLLFISLVSGILLLCEKKIFPNKDDQQILNNTSK